MYKIFKVTAETFDKNCVDIRKVNKTDNKSVLWINTIDIQTFMTWLIRKLGAKLRLIIQQMNKLKSIKHMDQN